MTVRSIVFLSALQNAIRTRKREDFDKAADINTSMNDAELLFIQELITLAEELTIEQQLKLNGAIRRFFFTGPGF